jgi:protein TonB
MDINKILTTDYLDIIFDGRNKKYGGYELRKNYPIRMARAFLIILAVVVLSGAYAFISSQKKEVKKPKGIEKFLGE